MFVKPILYTFRRCPYAMRARMAIQYSQVSVELREVVLRNKPQEMLDSSSKGTVPVLVLPCGRIIDESIDIMVWALQQSDPEHWLFADRGKAKTVQQLIEKNDFCFKEHLDRYKYYDRFPGHSQQTYRQRGEEFLVELEDLLEKNKYLMANDLSLADIAIFPFIRQFAHVDKQWFFQAPYPQLIHWLDGIMNSECFTAVMKKYEPWRSSTGGIDFSGHTQHKSS